MHLFSIKIYPASHEEQIWLSREHVAQWYSFEHSLHFPVDYPSFLSRKYPLAQVVQKCMLVQVLHSVGQEVQVFVEELRVYPVLQRVHYMLLAEIYRQLMQFEIPQDKQAESFR